MNGSDSIVVKRPGVELYGERWGTSGPAVVLLHEGVADRRSWHGVAPKLAERAVVVAYDRRGHGESAPMSSQFTHLDDLVSVLDQAVTDPAWLVGSSAGGGLALDLALTRPERVAGLVLLAPGVSGAQEPDVDRDTARLEPLLEAAEVGGDFDELNRLEAWLWLDGPAAPEGRVGGMARALFLEMNGLVVRNGVPEGAGASGNDAWSRLEEVTVPAVVACGELDVPFIMTRSRELARRLPQAHFEELRGVAHMSPLEQPQVVAQLVMGAVIGC